VLNAGSPQRDEIVRTALALLDEAGLDAVTLRSVARRRGVRLNTVSWHVKSKAGLQDLMADAVLAEIPLDGLPGAWNERVRSIASRYRRALLAHRDGGRLVAGTFTAGPGTLRVAETMVAALLDGGLSEQAAAWTGWTIIYFSLGLVQEEQGVPDAAGDRLEPALLSAYPALRKVLPFLAGDGFDARFEFGLDLILTGATIRN
jgi:TetR/AcrR family transcriptional regulator, tetracycline repressor protein